MSWATPADDNPFADPSVSAARTSGGPSRGYDDSAPSWLGGGAQGAAGGGSQPPPPPPQAPGIGVAPQQQAAAPTAAELEREAKVPQLMIYMRLANIGLCILLAATALAKLIVAGADLSGAVLAVYLFAFSCILCCFETHLKVVAKTIAANFGFLYNAKGRATFLVFVGVLCFSLATLLAYIAGVLMIVNAAFNFYVIFTYPEFERDLQRKDLESEGRDYLRANRGNLAQAGVEFARNNPDLARKGAQAAASTYV
ncbi:unnamed protein product [Scytosiphon promiscuus]